MLAVTFLVKASVCVWVCAGQHTLATEGGIGGCARTECLNMHSFVGVWAPILKTMQLFINYVTEYAEKRSVYNYQASECFLAICALHIVSNKFTFEEH